MPRLVTRTGVTVNVSDETAEAMGSAWTPAEDSKTDEKPTSRRKSSN